MVAFLFWAFAFGVTVFLAVQAVKVVLYAVLVVIGAVSVTATSVRKAVRGAARRMRAA